MVKQIIILLFLIIYSCSNYVVQDESPSVKINLIKDYIEDEKYSKAKIELEYLIMYDPLSEFSNQAQYYLSECYFYLGDYQQAIIEYERYLSRADYNPDYVSIVYFMMCKCYFNLSLEYNKDQSDTYIAIDKLQSYIEKDIMFKYISEIEEMILELRNKLAKKDFYTASLYVKLEEFESANIYYYSIVNNYYDTEYVNDSLVNIALLYFVNSKKPVEFLKNHKNSFLSNDAYNEALRFVEKLEVNQSINYYVSLLK